MWDSHGSPHSTHHPLCRQLPHSSDFVSHLDLRLVPWAEFETSCVMLIPANLDPESWKWTTQRERGWGILWIPSGTRCGVITPNSFSTNYCPHLVHLLTVDRPVWSFAFIRLLNHLSEFFASSFRAVGSRRTSFEGNEGQVPVFRNTAMPLVDAFLAVCFVLSFRDGELYWNLRNNFYISVRLHLCIQTYSVAVHDGLLKWIYTFCPWNLCTTRMWSYAEIHRVRERMSRASSTEDLKARWSPPWEPISKLLWRQFNGIWLDGWNLVTSPVVHLQPSNLLFTATEISGF